MRLRTELPFLLALAATPPAQTPVEAALKRSDRAERDAPAPVLPITDSIPLAQVEPLPIELPDGLVEPWCGSVTLAGRPLALVLAKSTAEQAQPDRLCIDLDGDGAIGDAECRQVEAVVREAGATRIATAEPIDVEFAAGAARILARIGYRRTGDAAPVASIQFPGYLEAEIELAGQPRIVAVLDHDLDGRFGTGGDLWTLTRRGERPAAPFALSGIQERRFEDGRLLALQLDGRSVTVTSSRAPAPDPADAAAHRARIDLYWSKRFDVERDGFVRAQQIDGKRPAARVPIAWRHVTFDEGLELARKSGKPLLVDVTAFWCEWCYRLDYYTYSDKAVAELVNREFVPVEIIEEQDRAGDYPRLLERLGANGIPAIGVFAPDGRVLHRIHAWRKPEVFLRELRIALDRK
jgi:hypothetical protein